MYEYIFFNKQNPDKAITIIVQGKNLREAHMCLTAQYGDEVVHEMALRGLSSMIALPCSDNEKYRFQNYTALADNLATLSGQERKIYAKK